MKLLRYGPKGQEKPGLLDDGGTIRDLSGQVADITGAVLDENSRPIPGLHACGELVGGVFFNGYPGGSGLTSGTVFGRRAGRGAALHGVY